MAIVKTLMVPIYIYIYLNLCIGSDPINIDTMEFPVRSYTSIWLLGQEVRAALAAAGVRRAKYVASQTGARMTPVAPKRTKAMVTKDSTLHFLMKKDRITIILGY